MKRRANTSISAAEDRSKCPSFSKGEEKRTWNSYLFSSSKRVFVLCLAFRMANSLVVQTYFNPDEHWQALEVAHHIAFGYGHLTWEWKKSIRSCLHPLLFAFLYKALSFLCLDAPWFMRGSEDVMNFLSKEALNGKVKSVIFLMPCHAMPCHTLLLHPAPQPTHAFLRLLSNDDKGILDESDRFMMEPVGFVSDMAKVWSLPRHLVLFDLQERLRKDFLNSHSFREIRKFFHAHFKVDRDLQASIDVYALKDQ